MNHQYAFLATPGLARRLVQFAKLSRTTVDEHIQSLATEALISREQFNALNVSLGPLQRSAIQKILDYDSRAVLLAREYDASRTVALAAAKLTEARPIVIGTSMPSPWVALAMKFGYSVSRNPKEDVDVLVVDPVDLPLKEVVEERRDGLLIVESNTDAIWQPVWEANYQGPAREFERTIAICNLSVAYQSYGQWTTHCDAAVASATKALFSHVPEALISNQSMEDRRKIFHALKARGYKHFRTRDLYPWFNIVPDLMDSILPK